MDQISHSPETAATAVGRCILTSFGLRAKPALKEYTPFCAARKI
jgi:hypothetical protein